MRKPAKMLAAMMVLSLAALPSEADTKVVVHQSQENDQEVAITTESTITFSETGFSVNASATQQMEFAYGNVESITFAVSGQSGINGVTATKQHGYTLAENPVGDLLTVITPATFKEARLSIVSFNGRNVFSNDSWTGTPVNVSSLAPGLYLLTIDSTTLKFIKK